MIALFLASNNILLNFHYYYLTNEKSEYLAKYENKKLRKKV